MRHLVSAISGGLFGLGLLISGMTDTAKVQGWLDLFGQWDPTLAFVLGGAILPMLLAWRVAARRKVSPQRPGFLKAPLIIASTAFDHEPPLVFTRIAAITKAATILTT